MKQGITRTRHRQPVTGWRMVLMRGVILVPVVSSSACTILDRFKSEDSITPASEVGNEQTYSTAQSDAADRFIVADLADVLVQLREPLSTTVQVGPVNDGVGEIVVQELIARGFGIQRVDADQGANLLSWQRIPAMGKGEDGLVEMRIGFGNVDVTRGYLRQDNYRLLPDSAFQLRGTRQIVRVDDTNFGDMPQSAGLNTQLQFVASKNILEDLPTISLITDEVVSGVVNRAANRANSKALNSTRVEVNNLYNSSSEDGYAGNSAFSNIRSDYMRVRGEVVIFADDSMRLGPDGKRQVEVFLENFQPNIDIVGLIGCSNGPTKLDIGNQGLAFGRSNRIAEELIALGVPRESILDEGCWSERSAGERFPSRGVVMELLRRPVG